MLPYASIADLVDRFGTIELAQLTDRAEAPTGEIDEAIANRALADASAEIDGYVGAKYTLPLSSTPEILSRVCCDIARYRLYDDQATEEVRRRYEDAIGLLSRISNGSVSLGFPDSPPAGIAFSAPPRIMRGLDY